MTRTPKTKSAEGPKHTITHAGSVTLYVQGAWRPTIAQLDELLQAASDAGAADTSRVEITDYYTRMINSRYSSDEKKAFSASIGIPVGPK